MSSIPIPITRKGITYIKLQPSYPMYDKKPKALVKPIIAEKMPTMGKMSPGEVMQLEFMDISRVEKNVIKINVPTTKFISNVMLF